MLKLTREERQRLGARYANDPDLQKLLKGSAWADQLLERALWEFGGELRGEIERYLGETPLIKTS